MILYWIENKKAGIGSFTTRPGAEVALKQLKKLGFHYPPKDDWQIVEYPAVFCPVCRKKAEKEIVDNFGSCLLCEKLRGESMMNYLFT